MGEGRERGLLGESRGTRPRHGDKLQESRLAHGGEAVIGPDGLKETLDACIGELFAEFRFLTPRGFGIGGNRIVNGLGRPVHVRIIEETGKVVERGASPHPLKVNEGGMIVLPKNVGALEIAMDEDLGFREQRRLHPLFPLGLGVCRKRRRETLIEGDFPIIKRRIEGRLKREIAHIGTMEGGEQFHDLVQLWEMRVRMRFTAGARLRVPLKPRGRECHIAEIFHDKEAGLIGNDFRDADSGRRERTGTGGITRVLLTSLCLISNGDHRASGADQPPKRPLAPSRTERNENGVLGLPIEQHECAGDFRGGNGCGIGRITGEVGQTFGVAVNPQISLRRSGVVPVGPLDGDPAHKTPRVHRRLKGLHNGTLGLAFRQKGQHFR